MALVTCPDCKSEISDAAPACPKCGRPATVQPATAVAVPNDQGVERILFQDATVKITNVRAIIHGKQTYAMSNVTSVNEFVEPRPGIFLLAGLVFGVPGLLCVKINVADSTEVGTVFLLLGGACIVGYFLSKPKYWVRIGTAGAEANAVWSHDPKWTRTVVEAMNEAIVTRG